VGLLRMLAPRAGFDDEEHGGAALPAEDGDGLRAWAAAEIGTPVLTGMLSSVVPDELSTHRDGSSHRGAHLSR